MFGWFAYDRFVNGNENAVNDMANGMKKVAQFSGEKISSALRARGLKADRRPIDRINAMGDFLELHKLPVGPAMTGMACLSSVKLKTIAEAFVPFVEGERLGGVLTIDQGDRTGMEQETDTGYLLGKELKGAMRKMGLKADEKENTFQYMGDNNLEVSKGIAHVFFLLAANRPKNMETADEIGKQLSSVGSYDNLPQNLKTRYQEMVVEGRQIAIDEYPNHSLVEIVESLNSRRKTEKEKLADTAAVIDDPRMVPARKNEFQTLGEPQKMSSPNALAKNSLLGLLENDVEEFLQNCRDSKLLTLDGSDELKRKFYVIRRSNSPITDILQATEKLKYAVMVTATKDRDPLTREKVITMTGPADLTAKAFLSRLENYLSQYVISLPRNFHTVSSLGDVRSMLNEPWFGQGPVSSLGVGFKDLEQRIDAYQKQVQDLKDLDALAERAAGALPPKIVRLFDNDPKKLRSALKTIVSQSSFIKRIDRAEAHLSQRMASALARSTALIATPDGYGRREDRLAITPKEQGNLVKEFDLLFLDVIGSTNGNGMWAAIEDMETNTRYTPEELNNTDLHYQEEPKRLEMIDYARDLALVYFLKKLKGTSDNELEKSIAERVNTIFDKTSLQREDDKNKKMQKFLSTDSSEEIKRKNDENLRAAQLIENTPSYKNGLPELYNILLLLGGSPKPVTPLNTPLPTAAPNTKVTLPVKIPKRIKIKTPGKLAPNTPVQPNTPLPSGKNTPVPKSAPNTPVTPQVPATPKNTPVPKSAPNTPVN